MEDQVAAVGTELLRAAVAWATLMFVVFAILTGFRFLAVQAIIFGLGGIAWAIATRHLIVRRERREGRLPARDRS